jgi:hypothetical protein
MQYAQHFVPVGPRMSCNAAWQGDGAGGSSIGGTPGRVSRATGRGPSKNCPPTQGLAIHRAGNLKVWAVLSSDLLCVLAADNVIVHCDCFIKLLRRFNRHSTSAMQAPGAQPSSSSAISRPAEAATHASDVRKKLTIRKRACNPPKSQECPQSAVGGRVITDPQHSGAPLCLSSTARCIGMHLRPVDFTQQPARISHYYPSTPTCVGAAEAATTAPSPAQTSVDEEPPAPETPSRADEGTGHKRYTRDFMCRMHNVPGEPKNNFGLTRAREDLKNRTCCGLGEAYLLQMNSLLQNDTSGIVATAARRRKVRERAGNQGGQPAKRRGDRWGTRPSGGCNPPASTQRRSGVGTGTVSEWSRKKKPAPPPGAEMLRAVDAYRFPSPLSACLCVSLCATLGDFQRARNEQGG